MNCTVCGMLLNVLEERVGFRDCCPGCGNALHSCKNCKFYTPGRRNDCMIPDTDYIANKDGANFCEEFKWLQKAHKQENRDLKKSFDQFFKDV